MTGNCIKFEIWVISVALLSSVLYLLYFWGNKSLHLGIKLNYLKERSPKSVS